MPQGFLRVARKDVASAAPNGTEGVALRCGLLECGDQRARAQVCGEDSLVIRASGKDKFRHTGL